MTDPTDSHQPHLINPRDTRFATRADLASDYAAHADRQHRLEQCFNVLALRVWQHCHPNPPITTPAQAPDDAFPAIKQPDYMPTSSFATLDELAALRDILNDRIDNLQRRLERLASDFDTHLMYTHQT